MIRLCNTSTAKQKRNVAGDFSDCHTRSGYAASLLALVPCQEKCLALVSPLNMSRCFAAWTGTSWYHPDLVWYHVEDIDKILGAISLSRTSHVTEALFHACDIFTAVAVII